MSLHEFTSVLLMVLRNVFRQDNPLGNVVVWSISLLFVASVAGIFSTLRRIRRERTWLLRAQNSFDRRDESQDLPLERTTLLAALDLEKAPADSLVVRQVSELVHILPLRGFDASLIRTLTGSHFELGGGFARFSAGTLTVIGLVGTVLGLSIAVGQLPSLLKGIDSEQGLLAFSGQMLATLSGMGTAFACTLAGLTGAVVLSLLNYIVRSRQATVLEALDDFIYLKLAPVLVPHHEDHSASAFVKRMNTAGEVLQALMEKALAAATAMQTGAEAIGRTTKDMAEIVAPMKTLAESTIKASEKLELILVGLAELKKLPEELGKLPKELDRLPGELRDLSRQMGDSLQAGVVDGFKKAADDLIRSLTEQQKQMRNEDRELKKDYAQLLIGVQEAVNEMLGQLSEPMQMLLQKESSLQQDVQKMTDEIRQLTGRLQDYDWQSRNEARRN